MAIPASATPPTSSDPALIEQLAGVCATRGLTDLALRLEHLEDWLRDDLRQLERDLSTVPRGPRVVTQTAHHLLDLDGKHLRPMCVALASKIGSGFGPAAREFAVAVELVHTATLLHDDVVDLGNVRRGAAAARCVYGNASSIFAGDWLLIQALKRVRRGQMLDVLDHMLSVIDDMILAESIQLEHRGRLRDGRDNYFRVVEGKTASLFRWAMFAGARAGGLATAHATALERYGLHLGIAFQAIDDVLDFAGESKATGKALFADLREGKITYPLVIALERDPALRPILERYIEALDGDIDQDVPNNVLDEIHRSLEQTNALDTCRELARQHVTNAIECLEAITPGPSKMALVTVAQATAFRNK